ncbi:alpha/beta hydrolase fold protein [Diaporthe helianthi]|uniref:Alpha/beta hydrolase fold protein n=1 Tax=Diaporthe helianthi TaxID=158607 RepID=A0A2P5HE46_DIAHE|nr:alpha/beta hydrolase fold protein [Diaporthe helianthi]
MEEHPDDASVAHTGAGAASGRHEKQLFPRKPLLTRVVFGLAVKATQLLIIPVAVAMTIRRWVQSSSQEDHPTIIKTYPVRPRLPVRIFFPEAYDDDRAQQPRSAESAPPGLPLLLSIHGGGFVVGEPSDNDAWNRKFANQHNALVVALNYAKAPGSPFPGPLADLEAQINAVFADGELSRHFDAARVGVVGFSAGGNLTLTITQFPSVRSRITAGIVPIYPVCDFSITPQQKAATRRYKPALQGSRAAPRDPLLSFADAFDWSYVPVGHDVRDPLLSPVFVERGALPERVWVIGCELDMLGHEAWRLACRLAGRQVPLLDRPIGQEAPEETGKLGALITTGDQRFAWEEKNRDGEVKWLCVPDAGHAFDMPGALGADEKTTEDGRLKRDQIITLAGEWLFGH